MAQVDFDKTTLEIFPQWVTTKVEKAEIHGIPNTVLRFRATGPVESFHLVGLPDFINAECKLLFCNQEVDVRSHSGILSGVALRQKLVSSPWNTLFNTKTSKFFTNMYKAGDAHIDYSNYTFNASALQDPFLYLVFDCTLDDEIIRNLSLIYKRINVLIQSDGCRTLRWSY